MVSICLNMIVKDESHIIEQTLTILSKYIHYWVITDTGSSDNTIEIINNFFKKSNIPGELYEDKWEDFGTNRTKSLERAYNKCDYIWVFDADDLIVGEPEFPKIFDRNVDSYYVKFGNNFTYERQQIFKSDLKWVYKGVLHEYVNCLSKQNINNRALGGNYYIESRRLGNRSIDPKKYLRDAETLIHGIKKDPENELRYMYYIGQSYKDYGDLESAIEWYKKRISKEGWIEEKFYSAYELANCMVKLNRPINDIINAYNHAHGILNERREPLFALGVYLKERAILENQPSLFTSAYDYLYKSIQIPLSHIYKLFVQYDIYEWRNKYELAVVNTLLNNYEESTRLCEELLIMQNIRKDLNILQIIETLRILNIKYNEELLIQYPKNIVDSVMERLRTKKGSDRITFTITTCKRYDLFEKTMNSFLNCCKDIQLVDRWVCIDDNSSEEDRENMKYQYPFFEFYYKTIEEKGHLISMNMIQDIVKSPYILHLEDDWLFIKKEYIIKPALYILESNHFRYIDTEAKGFIEKKGNQIAQVLLNLNYSEDIRNVILGGYMIETMGNPNIKCILHEHHEKTEYSRLCNKKSCAYWPHYSFRPSLFKREIFDKLGRFETVDNNVFFERIYADKYVKNGYLSCFYNKIMCYHIGKKTYEKNIVNAYDLNNVSQFNTNQTFVEKNQNQKNQTIVEKNYLFLPNQDSFGNDIIHYNKCNVQELLDISKITNECIAFNTYGYLKHKINDTFIHLPNVNNNPDGLYINKIKLHKEIYCINLDERDGRERMTKQFDEQTIKYHFVSAIKGSALSHKTCWENLMNEKLKHYYIIMEDNVELHPKYHIYLRKVQEKLHSIQNWDIMFISDLDKSTLSEKEENIIIEVIQMNHNDYLGGSQNYIISKMGAEKLLHYIKENDIQRDIDYIIQSCPSLETYQLKDFISRKVCINNNTSEIGNDFSLSPFIQDKLYIQRPSHNKTRIKLIYAWSDSKKICEMFGKMSKGNYIWNNIQITWEDTDIDFYVIINYPQNNREYYDPARTIVFQMEPWNYNESNNWGVKTWGIWAKPDENMFLQVRSHTKYLNNVEWHLSDSYTELMNKAIIKDDSVSNIISSVCTSKYFDVGHIRRIDFMKYIESKADPGVQLHIYGRDNNHRFNSYRGTIKEKEDGMVQYRYYFMCENNCEHNYATEKLWDAILTESLIFYWGCPNLSDYINPLAFVELDMDDFDKSFQIIKEAIQNNLWEQRIDIIREEKQKVLNYYSFFPTLERILFEDFQFSAHPTDEEVLEKKKILRLKTPTTTS